MTYLITLEASVCMALVRVAVLRELGRHDQHVFEIERHLAALK